MTDYLPFLLITLVIIVIAVAVGWPWLRQRKSRDVAALLTILSVTLSLALYLAVGNPFAVPAIAAYQDYNARLLQQIAQLNASGDSPKKWALLGEAHMELKQYAQAVEALRRAVLASEGNPDLILAYGKAQMLAADGKVTEGAKRAFILASKLSPDDPEPLFLLAMERMQAGDQEGARALYTQLLPRLPEGAPLRKRIEQQLDEAKNETP